MDQAEARKLWLEAVERVKDQTLAPTLWRALEIGHGVTVEGDEFIVGFPPAEAPMGGYLTSSEHRTIIEKALTQLVGKPVRLKIIEGTTLADFDIHKKREALAEQSRLAAQQRKHIERAAETAWETVMEQCSRKYANTPFRQLPQIRAQYLFEAVQILSEAMDRIHPDGKIDEIGHRAMARAIEKVASLSDVPGAMVAIELMKARRNRTAAS